MASNIQQGYMVLADISGFTAFMEQTEIEHSAYILNNIIQLMIERLSSVMQIAEVEGDAVFAFVPNARITRGELLLELMEATYAAYRDRQKTMQHNASCGCKACQSISSLDLKFVAHYGEYVLQNITGRPKPVGSSVNLVHRMVKNSVNASTGWRGYALFSEPCLKKMGIQPTGMHETYEAIEGMGTIKTGSIDLNARYRQLVENRRIFLAAADADLSVAYDFETPQPVVWDWMTDPNKRNVWFEGARLSVTQRPEGRTGPAAQYHCAASDAIEEILDWHPFDYYTVKLSKGRLRFLVTVEFRLLKKTTNVRWNLKYDGRLPAWIGRPLVRIVAWKKFKLDQNFSRLARMMTEAELEQAA
jgi:class 3 adenylate cyclase